MRNRHVETARSETMAYAYRLRRPLYTWSVPVTRDIVQLRDGVT